MNNNLNQLYKEKHFLSLKTRKKYSLDKIYDCFSGRKYLLFEKQIDMLKGVYFD